MRKKMIAAVLTTFVMIMIFMCSALTAMSSAKQSKELENYYLAQEKQLNKDTRAYLNMKGFKDSGVTVTRIVSEEAREYTVTVHHRKIDAMSGEDRENLANELGKLAFADDNCSFRYEFLLYE